MAAKDATATAKAPEPMLRGWRLRRGFVLFEGRRHRTLLQGEVVAADAPILPLLFRGGAALEPVTISQR